jgi:hypothetical protein
MGAGSDETTTEGTAEPAERGTYGSAAYPTNAEAAYLRPGLSQPGRKLPLFDAQGRPVRPQVIRACLARGWAERWFANPLAPDWLVCRLTDKGVKALERAPAPKAQ